MAKADIEEEENAAFSGALQHRGERTPVDRGARAEEALAHLTAIVDVCEDALISVTREGTITVWNRSAEALFGYKATEVLGRPLSMLVPLDRPDELSAIPARITAGEQIDHFETVRVRKDGTRIEVSLSVFPVRDATGTVIGALAIARDITENKRIEAEMHRWKDQLQAIVQGVDDAVIVREPGGRVVYANDNAAHLLGFGSVAELLRMPPAHVATRYQFYTETGEAVPAHLSPGLLALQGIEVTSRVLRYRLVLTGEERWAEIKAIPVYGEDGQVQFAVSIMSDITARRQAEEALKASELRFQAFMDNSPIVAFMKDEEARFVYVNPQFEAAFEITAAEIVGLRDDLIVTEEVARRIHMDDAEVLARGKLKQIVEVIPARDGSPRHWLTFKFPLSMPSGRRFIAGASIDVTEQVRAEEALKESEARFQAFMHNAPVVAYMKDEAGRVVFLNHAWEQLFGMPIADAIGKDDFQLQPPDLAERFRATDMEVLDTGEVKALPETVIAPDGTARHWMTFKFPIVLPSGARFVGGASVEITDRVRAEKELQQYAERLQILSRQLLEAQETERRRIARDLHDQVGQALTAIKIDLQIAQHQAQQNEERGSWSAEREAEQSDSAFRIPHSAIAGRLGKSINTVERTIQQVREFSLDLRPSILDDLGLPSALLWYAEEQASRAGFQAELAIQQLQARLSPELEITCFRIAQEAITNVVRHAGASRVAVELRGEGDELMLTVSDDGKGFDLQALYAETAGYAGPMKGKSGGEPSDRLAVTSIDRVRGLGLAGMNERMFLVGGRLSIESTPGAGTTVRAVFPLNARAPAGL